MSRQVIALCGVLTPLGTNRLDGSPLTHSLPSGALNCGLAPALTCILISVMSEEPALPEPRAAPPPLLTPSQRQTVGFALTLLAVLGSIALLIGALIVLGRSISFFSNVLWPLAAA